VRAKDGSWTIYRCAYRKTVQFVVTIAFTTEESMYSAWREDALGFIKKRTKDVYLSYLDTSIIGTRESYRGVVPCRSVWDSSAARLTAVLLI